MTSSSVRSILSWDHLIEALSASMGSFVAQHCDPHKNVQNLRLVPLRRTPGTEHIISSTLFTSGEASSAFSGSGDFEGILSSRPEPRGTST